MCLKGVTSMAQISLRVEQVRQNGSGTLKEHKLIEED